ncbi:sugar isomerase [Enterococcus faecium]|nr:polysaccharide biosynthesis C-terminal domain-containing protein [Enterococcus faecium]MBY3629359.1 sugar isomerase [Enterococcus faecium]
MERTARLKKNTIWALVFQITSIVCGMILLRLILTKYGSEVNGMISSINQFLQIISFLQLGVGAVMQSTLYKPLAEKDNLMISQILASGGKFYRQIAYILLVYVGLLLAVYYVLVPNEFGRSYTMAMIATLSINSFAQYYFGIVNTLLLSADQKIYITYIAQTIAFISNTVACALLISLNTEILMVKLITAIIYLACPIYYRWYVDRNYNIKRNVSYDKEPIPQKWNGVAQHVASVVLDSTDVVVLSIFSNLIYVSIYNVYNLVIYGVKQLFMAMTNGVQALLGELWVRKEIEVLYKTFAWFEWIVHTLTVFIFGCTGILIVPFIQVYTRGVTDANYNQLSFAALLVTANALHCLRTPYHVMIKAAGKYKETQNSFIIASLLNLGLSLILVKPLGLVGVALGSLISITYHTLWSANYNSKYLLKWPMKKFYKQLFVNILTVVLSFGATSQLKMMSITYLDWIVLAIKCAVIVFICIILVNVLFYRRYVVKIISKR